MGLSTIDIILSIPLAFGLIKGLWKGFVQEITSIVALVAGIIVAYFFSSLLQPYVKALFEVSTKNSEIIAFVAAFAGVYILVSLLGKMISKLLDFIALGSIDHILGGVFGLLKYVTIICIVLALINLLPPENLPNWYKNEEGSVLLPLLKEAAKAMVAFVF